MSNRTSRLSRQTRRRASRSTSWRLIKARCMALMKTRPTIKGPGLAEMIRKIDLAKAEANIAAISLKKLFVGSGLEKASSIGQSWGPISRSTSTRFTSITPLAARGPGDRILLFRRKPYVGKDFVWQERPLTIELSFVTLATPLTAWAVTRFSVRRPQSSTIQWLGCRPFIPFSLSGMDGSRRFYRSPYSLSSLLPLVAWRRRLLRRLPENAGRFCAKRSGLFSGGHWL